MLKALCASQELEAELYMTQHCMRAHRMPCIMCHEAAAMVSTMGYDHKLSRSLQYGSHTCFCTCYCVALPSALQAWRHCYQSLSAQEVVLTITDQMTD